MGAVQTGDHWSGIVGELSLTTQIEAHELQRERLSGSLAGDPPPR